MTDFETTPAEAAAHVLHHLHIEGGWPAGGFFQALLKAWDRADPRNSARLTQAFPAHGAAIHTLTEPGGVKKLQTLVKASLSKGNQQ